MKSFLSFIIILLAFNVESKETSKLSLLYQELYQYAVSTNGLRYNDNQAKKYAKEEIFKKGQFSENKNLFKQLEEAYNLARSKNYFHLNHKQSLNFAQKMIKRHGKMKSTSLAGQYREVYEFA